ncbi:MAG TPA: hypothetical protein VGH89_04440 [Pseudonocardia sp.]
MARGMDQLVGGNPAARFLAATAAVAVLAGDGLMLIGYTAQVRGQPSPVLAAPAGESSEPLLGGGLGEPLSMPVPGAGESIPGLGASTTPGGPAVVPAPAVAPAPAAVPAPAPSVPESAPRSVPKPHSAPQHRGVPTRPHAEHHWPAVHPTPEQFERHHRGPSPFARRCADGEISAIWCRGMPN